MTRRLFVVLSAAPVAIESRSVITHSSELILDQRTVGPSEGSGHYPVFVELGLP